MFAVKGAIIGDKRLIVIGPQRRLNHRVAAGANEKPRIVKKLRPVPIIMVGQFGPARQQHRGPPKRPRAPQWPGVPRNTRIAQCIENLQLQGQSGFAGAADITRPARPIPLVENRTALASVWRWMKTSLKRRAHQPVAHARRAHQYDSPARHYILFSKP